MRCTLCLIGLAALLYMQLPARAVTLVEDFSVSDLTTSDWFEDHNAWTNKQRATPPTTGWATSGQANGPAGLSGLRYTKLDASSPPVVGGQAPSFTSPDPNGGDPDGTDNAWSSTPIGFMDTIGFGPGTVTVPTVPATFTVHIDDPDTITRWNQGNSGIAGNEFTLAGTSFISNVRLLNKEPGFGTPVDPMAPNPGREGLVPELGWANGGGSLAALQIDGGFNAVFGKGGFTSQTLDLIVEVTSGDITMKMVGDGVNVQSASAAVADIEDGDKLWFDFYYSREGASDGSESPRPVMADFTIASLTVDTPMLMEITLPVPEPSAFLLLGMGLGGTCLFRRHR